MPEPVIVVVTGASGAGKTTLVRALEARGLEGVRCYFFDSIGVPSADEMTAQFGSPNGWQEAMTRRWIARLSDNQDGARIAVLDGQVRPSFVRAAIAEADVSRGRLVLVDCTHEVRDQRLRGERGQPDLVTRDMAAWAAYLRGQADALDLPIIDTTTASITAATDALVNAVLATWPNRSMAPSDVIPELAYPDVRAAADWLCRAFGFVERLRIGDHRAQLTFGEGSLIVIGPRPDSGGPDHAVMVRVVDADSHGEKARQAGARIVSPPTDYPYGERQYSAVDPGGHRWTFSQTIADVDPESWGGTLLR